MLLCLPRTYTREGCHWAPVHPGMQQEPSSPSPHPRGTRVAPGLPAVVGTKILSTLDMSPHRPLDVIPVPGRSCGPRGQGSGTHSRAGSHGPATRSPAGSSPVSITPALPMKTGMVAGGLAPGCHAPIPQGPQIQPVTPGSGFSLLQCKLALDSLIKGGVCPLRMLSQWKTGWQLLVLSLTMPEAGATAWGYGGPKPTLPPAW